MTSPRADPADGAGFDAIEPRVEALIERYDLPRRSAPPDWLAEWAHRMPDDFNALARRVAPTRIEPLGITLLERPETLDRIHPGWELGNPQGLLAVAETDDGSVIGYLIFAGAWRLVEVYPNSVVPLQRPPPSLLELLEAEPSGPNVQVVQLERLWNVMSAVMVIVGILGIIGVVVILLLVAGMREGG